jgi:hypothetical protein
MSRAGFVLFTLFFALVGRVSASNEAALDVPLHVICGAPGAVPGAISSTALVDEDEFYFGEAANALREEFRCYASGKLSDADISRFEATLLDGMTPRQVILAGLSLYRRQSHSPEAGKGAYKHWAPKQRMSDQQIEQALLRYAKKG